ncbi:glycosyltransferase involved in cell wall biosynthesis [Tahibacter aquaticus]|uniref:Glycosyltransferase involved in cell wall biosynthesis n=1 Tax=Tahibacter aquaticus TaxID=520092 RepID=A0A4R6YMR7_9GAMM|nr:glycosyltransferase family 4 protein [Tahibacter aquaticus]TDR38605.1 glycosyltransferase involved in cell wall biosynthesis [Tahibacter aquaticus]
MRVLILARHPSRALGGIEIQCELTARQLAAIGHEVCYAAAGGTAGTPPATYTIDTWTPGDAAQTATLIARARPDVIYLRHNKAGLRVTARAAARAGVPLVFAASSLQDVKAFSYHAKHTAWTPRRLASVAWQCLRSRWNWSGFRWVSAAVSLNADYTDRLPVQLRCHIPDSMEATPLPFRWQRRFVAWVAQIKDYKNPGAYVELARRCADLDIDFLMIGEVVSPRYRWVARGVDLPANFHYLGARTPAEVNGVLAAASALVHTCDPEGFGNNFIQAWLQGTPTLSLYFDPGGTIARERLGSVPGDLPGLERDLRNLLAEEDTRAQMGERAQNYARMHHDPAANARRLAEFFENVVGRAGAR